MHPILIAISLFLVGILENFLISINTDFRIQKSRWGCFTTSFVIAVTWCYIVGTVTENLTVLWLIVIYSMGYGVGDVLGLHFNKYLENIVKKYNLKLRKFRRHKLTRKK